MKRYRLGRERSLESLRVVPRKLWNFACFFNRKKRATFGRKYLPVVFPIYARCCIVAFTTRPWSFRASLITEGNLLSSLPTWPGRFWKHERKKVLSFTNLNQAPSLQVLFLFIQRPARLDPHLISGRQQGTAKPNSLFYFFFREKAIFVNNNTHKPRSGTTHTGEGGRKGSMLLRSGQLWITVPKNPSPSGTFNDKVIP